jgi:pimeloyl-ACP methyl ester carboxylesterase
MNSRKKEYDNEMNKYKLLEISYKDFNKTQIRYISQNNKKAFIWLHGFNDYYHHFHIGNRLLNDSFDLYAITLRNYGQTLIKGNENEIFLTDSLDNYIDDIDYCFDTIFNKLNKKYDEIILYGHSLGGLVISVYLEKGKYKNFVSKLVLNSPFYNFRYDNIFDVLIYDYLIPFLGFLRYFKLIPNLCLRKDFGDDPYKKYIFNKYYFEYKFKVKKKNIYLDWILAVKKFHKFIFNNKCSYDIPVLILYCGKNSFDNDIIYNEFGDCVLNINDIIFHSQNYFKNSTLCKIKDSIHDIFCSEDYVVKKAYNIMVSWINNDIKSINFVNKKISKKVIIKYDFYLINLFILMCLFCLLNYYFNFIGIYL